MSTIEMTAEGRSPGVPAAVRVLQLLLAGPLGALVVFGVVYFTAIAPPDDPTLADRLLGLLALGIGAGNVVVGLRLAGGTSSLWRIALGLVAAHAVFGIAKVAGGESEAMTFIAFDALALALLSTRSVRSWFGGRSGS